jgi:hypothetical protein
MTQLNPFKLKHFREWAQRAAYGETFVYHREPAERDPELFSLARKLNEAGMVFLFSRRLETGVFEKCAKRTPVAAHLVLDKVSASITVEPSTAYLDEKVEAA